MLCVVLHCELPLSLQADMHCCTAAAALQLQQRTPASSTKREVGDLVDQLRSSNAELRALAAERLFNRASEDVDVAKVCCV